jgi:hypothetical protein
MTTSALVLVVADRGDLTMALQTLAGGTTAMAIYAGALLHHEYRAGRAPSASVLVLVGAASAVVVAIAGGLLHGHPHGLALVVVGVTAAQAVLAIAVARPVVLVVTALAGLAVLSMIWPVGATLVAISAVWSAIHVVAVGWELLVQHRRPVPLRLATLGVAAFGLPLLAWPAAELTAVAGAVAAALGLAIAARDRDAGRFLVALGGGLVALAVVIHAPGIGVVAAWAVAATALVAIAALARDPRWLVAGLVLFALAALGGLPGAVHPRAATVGCLAASMLIAARVASRVDGEWFAITRTILVIAGHAAVLAAIGTELVAAITDVERQLVTFTLVFGGYAAALLAIGFVARDRLHRYLGLGLFGLALCKLGIVDVWTLRRLHQVLALLGLGALLVAAGFLYARFGRRLLALLRDG